MRIPSPESPAAWSLATEAITSELFVQATLAGAVRFGTSPWKRIQVRSIDLRGERHLQITCFDGRKTQVQNILPAQAEGELFRLLESGFAGIHITTTAEEIDIRTTKKGSVSVSRRAAVANTAVDRAHNRVKDVPLPEGRADRVLEIMGISTAEGRVRPTMRAKFTQINEFLKHLEHGLTAAGLRDTGCELRLLDCGCGSSYLTIAAHHYLNNVLHIPARILGVDVNEEAIRKSTTRSELLGEQGPRFACGRIGSLDVEAEIVLALHACDTATDDAIAQAIRGEARLLLSAPCCHHDLNTRLRPEGPAEVLRPLFRHGILKERLADLATDAFRALALRIMGYRTDVVEFVSPEHTARNVLIRAIRGTPVGEREFVEEYRELCRFWGATPYLERVMGESFRNFITPPAG